MWQNPNKKSLGIVLVLFLLLFIPEFEHEVLVNEMSFTFLNNVSETAFYLMLSALSLIWAFFYILYDSEKFKTRHLIIFLSIIPFATFGVLFSAFILSMLTGSSYNFLSIAYNVLDILVLSVFFLAIFMKFNKFFSSSPEILKGSAIRVSELRGAGSLFISLVFAIFANPDFGSSKSFENRSDELQSALGGEVFAVVSNYIKSSPLITSDIGQVVSFANIEGGKVRVSIWLDYSAKMKIDILGEKGRGQLDLTIGGDNYSSIEHFNGAWFYNGNATPIGFDGKKDESKIKSNLLKQLESKLESTTDCSELIPLIEKNIVESKLEKEYRLDDIRSTIVMAKCYEESGLLEKAADNYARHSFFIRPFPFVESRKDLPNLEESKKSLQKAMSLNPNYKFYSQWQQELDGIAIQSELATDPCNEDLRRKLKESFARRKVFYQTLPPCKKEE